MSRNALQSSEIAAVFGKRLLADGSVETLRDLACALAARQVLMLAATTARRFGCDGFSFARTEDDLLPDIAEVLHWNRENTAYSREDGFTRAGEACEAPRWLDWDEGGLNDGLDEVRKAAADAEDALLPGMGGRLFPASLDEDGAALAALGAEVVAAMTARGAAAAMTDICGTPPRRGRARRT